MDELSSTESEGGETYDGYDAQVFQSTPPPPTHAIVTSPPAPSAGINILDLQCALATHSPAPAPEVFVIPRRPVATPSSPRFTDVQSRDEVDPSTERPCGHSLTPPMTVLRSQQAEKLSCTCCKRKEMDAPNFSKAQRADYKAATRKCRDCTYQLPSTGPKNKRKRVRNVPRFRAKHADRPPRDEDENEQVVPDQRTKMTWQQWHEKKKLHEGAPPPRAAREERRQQPQPQSSVELPQLTSSQRLTPAEKKQLKRQRRAQAMAEIDRDPPPPRTRHPPRAAAVRAQEEWRHRPQPNGGSFVTSLQRQEESGELPKGARDASSHSGNSQHSTRDRFPSRRQSWY